MNREIKYRAKSNGEWVYGHYYNNKSYAVNTDYIVADVGKTDGEHFVIDGSTLGQYTGLKDKNGEPIFEGDVVDDGVWVEEISMKNPYWMSNINVDYKNGKIIGNIHEDNK